MEVKCIAMCLTAKAAFTDINGGSLFMFSPK